jgi:hypothetical protein
MADNKKRVFRHEVKPLPEETKQVKDKQKRYEEQSQQKKKE